MLVLTTASTAAVNVSFDGKDLLAHSDSKGVEGFKGCESAKLTPVSAYTFRLMRREISGKTANCQAPSSKWKQVDEKKSDNGSVLFENLSDGEYKVQCLVGKSIGCIIENVPEGFPERSIVYAQEYSSKIVKGKTAEREASALISSSKKNGLLLYPNPTQTEINVEVIRGDLQGEVHLVIYDMMGKELHSDNYSLEDGLTNRKLSTEGYTAGTYLVRVVDARGVGLEGKFVVVSE